MEHRDTIAAISTAVSQSGIGIIRISGDKAIEAADCLFVSPGGKKHLKDQPSHTIHYGWIRDPESEERIDEVLVSVMRAPRTFTAEDTVEINCHGGVYAMKRVLNAVLHCSGVRTALPGEFTKRAFLNGRIDLSQAEAVMDVISAKNEMALRSALGQLKGTVKVKIGNVRRSLLYDMARIESALDDPEHYSLEHFPQELLGRINEHEKEIEQLILSSDNGRLIREGIQTVIMGRPNAGKSSLMNRLLGEDRAIVTEIPGTTRDILTETMQLGEVTLVLKDTAGIRKTEDLVEQIGVERALRQAEDADLILYVIDSTDRLSEEDQEILKRVEDKQVLILLNKTDLGGMTREEMDKWGREKGILSMPDIIPVSMLDGEGLDLVENHIRQMFYQGRISFNDQVVITNERHKELLLQAKASLDRVKDSIEQDLPEDFFTIDMMDAYTALGEIIGDAIRDDLAEEIFSRFCMGK